MKRLIDASKIKLTSDTFISREDGEVYIPLSNVRQAIMQTPEEKITLDLKPCPFCGGEAMIFVSEGGGVFVLCRKCNVRTSSRIDTNAFQEPTHAVRSAIDDWNRRTSDE